MTRQALHACTKHAHPLFRAAFSALSSCLQENKDAAWYYPTPKDAAKNIKDHVAFWKGVSVQ
jgi:uncharacterized protein (DUF427 family)